MLTKEEYLEKIGKTEDELCKEGLELSFIGSVGYDDDDGWEVVYKDPTCAIEVGFGCKCTVLSIDAVHNKL